METGKIVPEDERILAATEVAHILPFSLGSFDEDKQFEVSAFYILNISIRNLLIKNIYRLKTRLPSGKLCIDISQVWRKL